MFYGSRAFVKLAYAVRVMYFHEVSLWFMFQSDLMGKVTDISAAVSSLTTYLTVHLQSFVWFESENCLSSLLVAGWGLGSLWHPLKSNRKPTQIQELIEQCSVKQITVQNGTQPSNITSGIVDLCFKYVGTVVIDWYGIHNEINPLTPELNPYSQRYLTRFLLGILLLESCISLIYAWKTNKYNNYSFSLSIKYGSSHMFRCAPHH
jgi:hypothetical protein